MTKKIIELFKLPSQLDREIGLEIEMEGRNLAPAAVGWNVAADGSLRGESLEYVLKKPIKAAEVDNALNSLTSAFKQNNSTITPSDRCGVHVHVNVQQMTIDELFRFIVLYLTVEDFLVKWCGDDREGNLFCLRSRDAEALIHYLVDAVQRDNLQGISNRDIRYAALNLVSLQKYGSLEFRALRTPRDFDIIKTWVQLLLDIKQASSRYRELHQIVEEASFKGAERFLTDIFGDRARLLRCKGADKILMDAARRIQEIAYAPRFKRKAVPGELPEWYTHTLERAQRYCAERGCNFVYFDPVEFRLWFTRRDRRPNGEVYQQLVRIAFPPVIGMDEDIPLPDNLLDRRRAEELHQEQVAQQAENNRIQIEVNREAERAHVEVVRRETEARARRNAQRRAARAREEELQRAAANGPRPVEEEDR